MEQEYSIFTEDWSPASEGERREMIERIQSGNFHLSFSALYAFSVSPSAFLNYKCGETKTTNAMLLGSVLHCLVLEESEFKNRYMIGPDAPLNTAPGKNEWAEFIEQHTSAVFDRNKQGTAQLPKKDELFNLFKTETGMELIPSAIHEDAKRRAKTLVNNPACRKVFNQITQTEAALPEDFEVNGIKFRGRIDGIGDKIILDLKNMPSAVADRAIGSVFARKLTWQMYLYDEAFGGGRTPYILAVDGNSECCAIALSDNHLSRAKIEVRQMVTKFKELVLESLLFGPKVWDASQNFWAKTELNQEGIYYL